MPADLAPPPGNILGDIDIGVNDNGFDFYVQPMDDGKAKAYLASLLATGWAYSHYIDGRVEKTAIRRGVSYTVSVEYKGDIDSLGRFNVRWRED